MFHKIKIKFLIFLVVHCCTIIINAAPKNRTCYQYPEHLPKDNPDFDYDYLNDSPYGSEAAYIDEPRIITCEAEYDFCYSVWKTDENGTKVIIRQGCWQQNANTATQCIQEDCQGSVPKKDLYYCCCNTDNCNRNVTEVSPKQSGVISNGTSSPVTSDYRPLWLSPIFLICISLSFILISLVAFFVTCRQGVAPGPETAPLSPSGPGYSSNLHNVDNLKVQSLIGQGRYGTVWKGLINEEEVAVKIFPAQHKQYFINERNIYSTALMDSPSLLQYFGCDERRNLDDNLEYFLVLSLAPLGCLQSWLMENTPNYVTFVKMAKSICRGLSHLHTELQRGDELKPCICHRDLNTRNILVKSDLSCCLADFGFALKTFGSRYEYKGEMALAETKSISEVGTLRYMAPEILEGAVNLRDCETALKQIDVYSLGLVLWELSVRCQDLYPQGQTVPSYKAPYEAESGKNPTFEQMQVLVSRHKARPLFPPGWGGGQAGKITKDTCEDCWDHDAEARLTALCAEERIHELSNIRPRSHISRGPSPPLSANNLVINNNSPSKFRSISSSNSYNSSDITTTTSTTNTSNGILYNQQQNSLATANSHNNHMLPRVKSYSSDTGSTVVSLNSPIIHVHHNGFANGVGGAAEKNHIMVAQQIQPYQGRNPCQERNLAPANRKQHQVLVEKSKKHSFIENANENSFSCLEDDVSVEDLISNNSHKIIEETSIMGEGFPKQNNTDKKLKGWYGVRALIQKKLFRKDSGISSSAYNDEKSNLVDNRLTSRIIASPTKDITVNFIDGRNRYHHNYNLNSSNNIIQMIVEPTTMTTTAISSNSSSTRRPSNLDLTPITVRVNGLSPENNKSNLIRNISDDMNSKFRKQHTVSPNNILNSNIYTNNNNNINSNNINHHNSIGTPITSQFISTNESSKSSSSSLKTMKPVAISLTQTAESPCTIGNVIDSTTIQPPRLVISNSANAVKNLNNSNSTPGSIRASTMMINDDTKLTRQRSLEIFKEVFSGKGSTEHLRDPSQRIKTPGDVPKSVRKIRASKTLSLYDDRMMDSSTMNGL
ncbi:bone morphogenetic protein receptor type-2 [Condylostylus longicornis]|uniref:bone morphogenetic protein receptor type-2 n=1 Tax=Condylostylus longicornis TaxID=2530218 RepID=UPI00244DF3DD|nr:bone morphogenetic protein receptor type-2 [Condylostylus longicornis]